MASFGAVSKTELGRRRQKLRQLRRARLACCLWQMPAASAIAGGLLWWIAQPVVDCPIGTSEGGGQSVAVGQGGAVFGAAVLPAVAVGDSTAGAGRKTGVNGWPIAKAKVTRNLFPPSLTIEVA